METNQDHQQDYLTFGSGELQPLPNSTATLVLGILSIVLCGIGFILGIIGLVMAKKDLTLYANNPGTYSEASYNNTKTGRICSIIGIVVSTLVVLLYIGYFIWIFSMIKGIK